MKKAFFLFAKRIAKLIIISTILILLWQLAISILKIPHYIAATPADVLQVFIKQGDVLIKHSKVTLIEIILGLLCGFTLGIISATILIISRRFASLLLPILVLSQAIPVFAIAPLLVLWLGYGMISKIVMAILIIYFPITTACYDGLRNTPQAWLEMAQSMQINSWKLFFYIRLPASLPALASGLRIAVSLAPIGAIVGEWVGSAEGLGYLMLQANGRMQTNMVFAALFILIILTLTLYFLTDKILRIAIPWQKHFN